MARRKTSKPRRQESDLSDMSRFPPRKSHLQRVEDARHYAEADKSDPFAFMRAMNHMKSGFTSFTRDGKDAYYQAEPVLETRRIVRPDGSVLQWEATVYKNRARP